LGDGTRIAKAVFSTFAAKHTSALIEVDRNRGKTLQVDVDDIFNT